MDMNLQIILFDLDGTLLTSDNVVSLATANAIKICKNKGYLIGFITARVRSEKTIHLLDGLPCDFIAFCNGAEIYAKNRLIERNSLPYRQAVLILQNLNEDFPSLEIDVYQYPWSYSSVYEEIFNMESGDKVKCNIHELPNCDVQSIRLKSDILNYIPLQNYMSSESTFYYSTFGDVIIGYKNATKGHAVKKASEFFDIPLTNMIAFGDDVNDIGMLKNVGTSIAMGNAVASLKEIADYVTKTNDCDGVAIWLNEHLSKKSLFIVEAKIMPFK